MPVFDDRTLAQPLINELAEGKSEQATADSDPHLKSSMSVTKLRDDWKS